MAKTIEQVEKEISSNGTFTPRETKKLEEIISCLISNSYPNGWSGEAWALNEIVCLKEQKCSEDPISREAVLNKIKDGSVSVSNDGNDIVFQFGDYILYGTNDKPLQDVTEEEFADLLYGIIDTCRQPREEEYDPDFEELIEHDYMEWNGMRNFFNDEISSIGFSESDLQNSTDAEIIQCLKSCGLEYLKYVPDYAQKYLYYNGISSMYDVLQTSAQNPSEFEIIGISSENIQLIRQDEDLFCRNFGLNLNDVLQLVQG